MRIGVDARELLGRPTGVGRYLHSLLSCWAADPEAADVSIELFTPAPLPLLPAWRGPGARIAPVTLPGGTGTRWEQTTLPRGARGRADVLFCPGYATPLFCSVPTVVTIHDVSFWAHPEWFRPREGFRRRWTSRLSARRARRVLTVSEFSKAEIVRWLGVPPDRVTVTLEGIGASLPEPTGGTNPQPDSGPRILYAGSILNRRHVPDLVRAFAPIARRWNAARLILVGENRTWPREDPLDAARAEGIAGQVDVRDFASDEELGALYRSATVFAYLSTYEGFGLTPLEAMAAGLPVVAYDTPVAREIYGDAAWLVPPGNIAGITDALLRVIEDTAERERLRAAAARRLTRYSWSRTAALSLAALRDAAAR